MTELKARVPGMITAWEVAVGDEVKFKQVVGSMEAMKMNQPLPCPADGVVKEIKAEVGARVKAGEVIMVIE